MATLHLVRHGQASFGAENYDSLSDLGKQQCLLLGKWWKERGLKPARVVCGPMVRHQQSLEAFSQGFGRTFDVEFMEGIAEFDHENVIEVFWPLFGNKVEFERFMAETPKSQRHFHDTFVKAVARWHSGKYDHEYNESWSSFRRRVGAAFDAMKAPGGDALVFTSGGVISVIIQEILGFSDAKSFAVNAITLNSSVSRVLYRANENSLLSFNGTAHLDVHNDSSLITFR